MQDISDEPSCFDPTDNDPWGFMSFGDPDSNFDPFALKTSDMFPAPPPFSSSPSPFSSELKKFLSAKGYSEEGQEELARIPRFFEIFDLGAGFQKASRATSPPSFSSPSLSSSEDSSGESSAAESDSSPFNTSSPSSFDSPSSSPEAFASPVSSPSTSFSSSETFCPQPLVCSPPPPTVFSQLPPASFSQSPPVVSPTSFSSPTPSFPMPSSPLASTEEDSVKIKRFFVENLSKIKQEHGKRGHPTKSLTFLQACLRFFLSRSDCFSLPLTTLRVPSSLSALVRGRKGVPPIPAFSLTTFGAWKTFEESLSLLVRKVYPRALSFYTSDGEFWSSLCGEEEGAEGRRGVVVRRRTMQIYRGKNKKDGASAAYLTGAIYFVVGVTEGELVQYGGSPSSPSPSPLQPLATSAGKAIFEAKSEAERMVVLKKESKGVLDLVARFGDHHPSREDDEKEEEEDDSSDGDGDDFLPSKKRKSRSSGFGGETKRARGENWGGRTCSSSPSSSPPLLNGEGVVSCPEHPMKVLQLPTEFSLENSVEFLQASLLKHSPGGLTPRGPQPSSQSQSQSQSQSLFPCDNPFASTGKAFDSEMEEQLQRDQQVIQQPLVGKQQPQGQLQQPQPQHSRNEEQQAFQLSKLQNQQQPQPKDQVQLRSQPPERQPQLLEVQERQVIQPSKLQDQQGLHPNPQLQSQPPKQQGQSQPSKFQDQQSQLSKLQDRQVQLRGQPPEQQSQPSKFQDQQSQLSKIAECQAQPSEIQQPLSQDQRVQPSKIADRQLQEQALLPFRLEKQMLFHQPIQDQRDQQQDQRGQEQREYFAVLPFQLYQKQPSHQQLPTQEQQQQQQQKQRHQQRQQQRQEPEKIQQSKDIQQRRARPQREDQRENQQDQILQQLQPQQLQPGFQQIRKDRRREGEGGKEEGGDIQDDRDGHVRDEASPVLEGEEEDFIWVGEEIDRRALCDVHCSIPLSAPSSTPLLLALFASLSSLFSSLLLEAEGEGEEVDGEVVLEGKPVRLGKGVGKKVMLELMKEVIKELQLEERKWAQVTSTISPCGADHCGICPSFSFLPGSITLSPVHCCPCLSSLPSGEEEWHSNREGVKEEGGGVLEKSVMMRRGKGGDCLKLAGIHEELDNVFAVARRAREGSLSLAYLDFIGSFFGFKWNDDLLRPLNLQKEKFRPPQALCSSLTSFPFSPPSSSSPLSRKERAGLCLLACAFLVPFLSPVPCPLPLARGKGGTPFSHSLSRRPHSHSLFRALSTSSANIPLSPSPSPFFFSLSLQPLPPCSLSLSSPFLQSHHLPPLLVFFFVFFWRGKGEWEKKKVVKEKEEVGGLF